MISELDWRIRLATFQWLKAQIEIHGDVLPRALLERGFDFEDERIVLLGPQGIFKPRLLDVPLTIATVPGGPYPDSYDGKFLRYSYRGTDIDHRDNKGLRTAMERQLPLVYFLGLVPGRYLVVRPVYIVADHPSQLAFDVAVDDIGVLADVPDPHAIAEDRAEIRREYVTTSVKRRLHQQAFRLQVIEAYRQQCAFCRLKHVELLDAAHITADAHPEGEPVVSNGLSLCKLHHAAFDQLFLAVRPDYIIEVRQSVLDEKDGPMLLHGLQGMHLQPLTLPHALALRPDKQRLEARYEQFRARG